MPEKILKQLQRYISNCTPSSAGKYALDTEDNIIAGDITGICNAEEGNDAVSITDPPDSNKITFSYFLDGARRVYKTGDLISDNNIYPIFGAQISISCLKRNDRDLTVCKDFCINEKIVIIPKNMPCKKKQLSTDFGYFEILTDQPDNNGTNSSDNGTAEQKIKIDDEKKSPKRAVSVAQKYMLKKEMEYTWKISNLINEQNDKEVKEYIIKDGSLEYRDTFTPPDDTQKPDKNKIYNNYRYVIGVAKSFKAENCYTGDYENEKPVPNPGTVAKLKPLHRTRAQIYTSNLFGLTDIGVCVWYLRLRNSPNTHNVFDGVVKITRIVKLTNKKLSDEDTKLIDIISYHLLKERNPVCYNLDTRWPQHIYPVYIAENYAKNTYLSDELFLSLF